MSGDWGRSFLLCLVIGEDEEECLDCTSVACEEAAGGSRARGRMESGSSLLQSNKTLMALLNKQQWGKIQMVRQQGVWKQCY